LLTSTAAAQQPSQRPAPWGGDVGPPTPILGLDDARPVLPLEFSRAWLSKVEAVRQSREQLRAEGRLDGRTPEELAADGAALAGTLRVPVIPVRYADVQTLFSVEAMNDRLFGSSRGDTVSYADYWREVSGGLLKVDGEVTPWITLRRPAEHYLPASQFGWSSFGRTAELREEALAAASRLIDFAQFDNDGPDGKPDSGDDDGYVDFVAIVYALPCPGDHRAGAIWPHRAAMAPVETHSIGANGRPIRIADYMILPAVDPETCGPMQIGVLAHETGHALGLPDLYDYDGTSQGIGSWGLMGTGSHVAHHSPAHPGAWEKEQLGWVRVSWLERADSTMHIEPVQRSRTVYRFDGDAGEYLLFENRQRLGSDRYLAGTGLLVWHVDPERAELGAWNTDERRAAVGLIEADARADLANGFRADAGDPYPGRTKRDWFRSHLAGGLQFTGIRVSDHVVTAHVVAGDPYPALLPSPDAVRLTTMHGGQPVQQQIQVRRTGAVKWNWTPRGSASWLRLERSGDTLVLTADPDQLDSGTYADTVRLVDRNGKTLATINVSFYLATPGVAQEVATELPWSWGVAVRGAHILQASYGWDQLGLRPRPRVLQLWEGSTHAQTLTRLPADALFSPIVDQRDGATFVLARAASRNYLYQIDSSGDAQLIASDIGEQPAYGAAVMPDGSIAVAEWNGNISRVRRDGTVTPWLKLGENVYQIASDDAGNLFAATYPGYVLRIAPNGSRRIIATEFGVGKLVAITTTPAGDVIAAERGDLGRILRVTRDGARELVYRSPGSRFYGLAVDAGFLYALDLKSRDLLRIPLPESTGARASIVADRQH
jgi:M6 family metalloprotease-like protein